MPSRSPSRRSSAWSWPSWSSADSRPSGWSPPKRTRSPSPSGSSWSRFAASCARSHLRRSSRSSASIVSWSSARCSGDSDRSSDCIAAIRSASCSTTSSRVAAPGKKSPCWARKSSTSARLGSSPESRFDEQPVQVLDHRALGGQVLGLHALDRVGEPLAHPVEHAAAQPVDEGVEPLAGRGVHEVVVLEAADPGADVGRQRVEGVEPLGRDAPEHPLEVGVRARRAGLRVGGGRVRLAVEPLLDTRPLGLDDLVQLLPDVRERVRERALAKDLLAALAQPVEQVAQAAEVAARRVARAQPALHQPAERLAQVAVLQDVVREGVHDLVGREVRDVLAAVPAPVLRGGRQGRVAARDDAVRSSEVAGVGGQEGHARPIVTCCRDDRAGRRPGRAAIAARIVASPSGSMTWASWPTGRRVDVPAIGACPLLERRERPRCRARRPARDVRPRHVVAGPGEPQRLLERRQRVRPDVLEVPALAGSRDVLDHLLGRERHRDLPAAAVTLGERPQPLGEPGPGQVVDRFAVPRHERVDVHDPPDPARHPIDDPGHDRAAVALADEDDVDQLLGSRAPRRRRRCGCRGRSPAGRGGAGRRAR